MEGALVNQHLGEAERLLVYKQDAAMPGFQVRKKCAARPSPGGGDARWADAGRPC